MIHSTAIIDAKAKIHKSVEIGPYTVIGPRVHIGANTRIGAHCVIGGPPESSAHWDNYKHSVRIGADCWINHHVTIDSGTCRHTIVENSCIILRAAHVGHDAHICEGVTLSCSVLIGGHAVVMTMANIGLGAIVHQRQVIGAIAMIGANSFVSKTTMIEPFFTYVGSPARQLKQNDVGVARSGLDKKSLDALRKEFDKLINIR